MMVEQSDWNEIGANGKSIPIRKLTALERRAVSFAPMLAKLVDINLKDGSIASGRLYTVSPTLDFALREARFTRNGSTTYVPPSKTLVVRSGKWVNIRSQEAEANDGFKTDSAISNALTTSSSAVTINKELQDFVPFFDKDVQGVELGADGPETGWDSASMIKAFDQRNPGKTSYKGIDSAYTNVEVPVLDPATTRKVDEMARRTRPTNDEYIEGKDEESAFASVIRPEKSKTPSPTKPAVDRSNQTGVSKKNGNISLTPATTPYGQRVFHRQKNPGGKQFSSANSRPHNSQRQPPRGPNANSQRSSNFSNRGQLSYNQRFPKQHHNDRQSYPRRNTQANPSKTPAAPHHQQPNHPPRPPVILRSNAPVVNEWELRKQQREAAAAAKNNRAPVSVPASTEMSKSPVCLPVTTSCDHQSAVTLSQSTPSSTSSAPIVAQSPSPSASRTTTSTTTSPPIQLTVEEDLNLRTSAHLRDLLDTAEEYIPSSSAPEPIIDSDPVSIEQQESEQPPTTSDEAMVETFVAPVIHHQEPIPVTAMMANAEQAFMQQQPVLPPQFMPYHPQQAMAPMNPYSQYLPWDVMQHNILSSAYLSVASLLSQQNQPNPASPVPIPQAANQMNAAYYAPPTQQPQFAPIDQAQILSFLHAQCAMQLQQQQQQSVTQQQPFYPGVAAIPQQGYLPTAAATELPVYQGGYPILQFPTPQFAPQPIFTVPPTAATYLGRVAVPPSAADIRGRGWYRGGGRFNRGRRASSGRGSRRGSGPPEGSEGHRSTEN